MNPTTNDDTTMQNQSNDMAQRDTTQDQFASNTMQADPQSVPSPTEPDDPVAVPQVDQPLEVPAPGPQTEDSNLAEIDSSQKTTDVQSVESMPTMGSTMNDLPAADNPNPVAPTTADPTMNSESVSQDTEPQDQSTENNQELGAF